MSLRTLARPLIAVGAAGVLALALAALPTVTASAKPAVRNATEQHIAVLRAELRNGTLAKSHGVDKICTANHLRCMAEVLTAGKSASAGSRRPLAFRPPIGYGASELERAYGLTAAPSRNGTIAIIGAGAYPTLASDLAIYRQTYHLPACTTANGCFRQINYRGGAPYAPAVKFGDQFAEEDVSVETSLDVDMASAACPGCKIISIQVPLQDALYGSRKHIDNAILHFATGVVLAHQLGARAVSISYGYPTSNYSDKGTIQSMMTQPGMAIVASSGDSAFSGNRPSWPENLRTVTSVGGTSLYPPVGPNRAYRQLAWSGAGSGCSRDLSPAIGQPRAVSRVCGGTRTATDISAVADPATGVAVYNSYAPATGQPLGFIVVGGTSVSSPFIGGLYARAPANPNVLGPNGLYAAKASSFGDVSIGTNAPGGGLGFCSTIGFNNKLCESGIGWDGPTGLGVPKGLQPFRA